MPTSYTSLLGLAQPADGELTTTWGQTVNTEITALLEEAVAGRVTINTWTTNSHTLTTADGSTAEARHAIINLTDTGTALSGAGTLVTPSTSKIYLVTNNTGQTITVKTAAGTGIAVPDTEVRLLACDGTNVIEAASVASNGGFFFTYTWSTDTGTGDPGAGIAKINNADISAGSRLRVDDLDAGGTDAQSFMREILNAGDTSKQGYVQIRELANPDHYRIFSLSDTLEDVGYFRFTIVDEGGSVTTFPNGAAVSLAFQVRPSGSAGLTVSVISANTTATAGTHYHVDTAGVTVTLPATPTAGDEVAVSVDNFTNTVVARNGSNINEVAEDLTIDITEAFVLLRYVDATQGWLVVQQSVSGNATGLVAIDTAAKTAAFTATENTFYAANTTSSAFTITLPATPAVGTQFGVTDYAGTFGTNNLTLGRNGVNILGSATDFVLDVNWLTVRLVYFDATQGWIFSQ